MCGTPAEVPRNKRMQNPLDINLSYSTASRDEASNDGDGRENQNLGCQPLSIPLSISLFTTCSPF
jgi:hypothetical protein